MFALAVPVVMAELGWMTMGVVDTVMVGRIGPEAIGAVGIGSSLFMAVCIFAMGLLLGLDTLVAHAFGAGRLDECHRWLACGVVLSLLLSGPITIVILALSSALSGWGIDPAVLQLTQPYLDVLAWSIPPLLLYASFRRYLQGMGAVRPVMMALVFANILNAVVNWILIFGHLGAPAMGVRGSAWATVIARIVMAAVLAVVIVYRERTLVRSRLAAVRPSRAGWSKSVSNIDLPRMRRLLALGLPAASQVTLEVGVFARTSGACRACRASDRRQPCIADLHGAARNRVRRSGSRRPCRRTARSRRSCPVGLDGNSVRRVVHVLCGGGVPACPATPHRCVHKGSGGRRDWSLSTLRRRAVSAV
jgi:MATE family multidrug resistance protein